MDDLERLRLLRSAGVKSAKISGDRIVWVEFYPRSDQELAEEMADRLTNAERHLYDNMSDEERAQADRERIDNLLYHSS